MLTCRRSYSAVSSGPASAQYALDASFAQVTRWTIDAVGSRSNNAYIVSPSNMMPPEIPLENLEALFEAAHDQ